MKYEKGDKVWVMVGNKPVEVTIDKAIEAEYGIANSGKGFAFRYESEIFPSKEELLKSL